MILKQALNHGLVLKKVHRVNKFYRKAWLNKYIDMNTELRKMKKIILKNVFLSSEIIRIWKTNGKCEKT